MTSYKPPEKGYEVVPPSPSEALVPSEAQITVPAYKALPVKSNILTDAEPGHFVVCLYLVTSEKAFWEMHSKLGILWLHSCPQSLVAVFA